MSEMSGLENIPHCPRVAMHLIESSHDPLSSGYAYDSVPTGRAMMEHDKHQDWLSRTHKQRSLRRLSMADGWSTDRHTPSIHSHPCTIPCFMSLVYITQQ